MDKTLNESILGGSYMDFYLNKGGKPNIQNLTSFQQSLGSSRYIPMERWNLLIIFIMYVDVFCVVFYCPFSLLMLLCTRKKRNKKKKRRKRSYARQWLPSGTIRLVCKLLRYLMASIGFVPSSIGGMIKRKCLHSPSRTSC